MNRTLRVLTQPCCSPGSPPLEEGTARTLAGRFKALSDPSRVSIVNRLAGADAVCVCDFIGTLGLSQPTVSHHLKVLREAGLVEVARKRGTWVYYRLVPEAVSELAFALGGGRDHTEAAAPIQVGASADFSHAEAV
jgi:ArsR family transcriptional regulator